MVVRVRMKGLVVRVEVRVRDRVRIKVHENFKTTSQILVSPIQPYP